MPWPAPLNASKPREIIGSAEPERLRSQAKKSAQKEPETLQGSKKVPNDGVQSCRRSWVVWDDERTISCYATGPCALFKGESIKDDYCCLLARVCSPRLSRS